MRGCTGACHSVWQSNNVSPAQAGLYRSKLLVRQTRPSVPRARGAVPHVEAIDELNLLYPARAGLNRPCDRMLGMLLCIPRLCGAEPTCRDRCVATFKYSPRLGAAPTGDMLQTNIIRCSPFLRGCTVDDQIASKGQRVSPAFAGLFRLDGRSQ